MSYRTKLAFNASWEAEKAAKGKAKGCRHSRFKSHSDRKPLYQSPILTSASSPLSGPIIALYAGADNLPFYVHANVMCPNSHYFNDRFGGPIVPPERDLHLHFPAIDPADMSAFTHYMYRLFWKEFDLGISTSPNKDILDHVRLYITACIFDVPFLRERVNGAIAYLIEREDGAYISALNSEEFEAHLECRKAVVEMVYAHTKESDKFRYHFVKSMGMNSDYYYDCGVKHNIDMDENLTSFFRLVPKFSHDLKVYLCKEKGLIDPNDEDVVEEEGEEGEEGEEEQLDT